MVNHKNHSANKNALLKVIILGDGGVGKSCLMNRFVNNQFDIHSFHTIGVEFLNKEMKIKNETYTLQVWDTAGQERFKSLRTPFYRGSDICMLTFAVDDIGSFRNLSMWRNEFLSYSDMEEGKKFPFVVVANKVDVAEEKREVSEAEAKSWCKDNGCLPYIETSAKDAINVDHAFTLAVDIWSQLEADLDREGLYEDNGAIRIKHTSSAPRGSSCCSFN